MFLLGPVFPIALGFAFGGIGAQVDRNIATPTVAVLSSPEDFQRLMEVRARLSPLAEERPIIALRAVKPDKDIAAQRAQLLVAERQSVVGVLEGGLFAPHFTGALNADSRTSPGRLLVDEARRLQVQPVAVGQPMTVTEIKSSAGVTISRSLTRALGRRSCSC